MRWRVLREQLLTKPKTLLKILPELEQLAGTQTRGLAKPLSMRTMEPMRPMVAARPRSSLSYTLALLKLWISLPMMAGMLMMSNIAMMMMMMMSTSSVFVDGGCREE